MRLVTMSNTTSGRRAASLVLFAALTVASAACASGAPSIPSTPVITAAPPVTSPPTPPAEASLPPEILEAIAFREEMGLRSDVGWVQAVAANPAAVLDWGVPLMAFEVAELEGRPTGEDAMVGVVQAYLAEHPDISGGVYLDQARGGIVTMLVTADPAGHEAAIREEIGADAPLVVRQVRWTEQELTDLQQRLFDGRAFLDGIPARMTTTSTDIIANQVELTISSAVPDAAQRIIAQFGAEEGQLRVVSDGTGLLLLPVGRVEGRITAPPGVDVQMLSPQYEADVDIGPRDAVGIGVRPDGTFTIEDLPPTTYRIYVLELLDAGNREVASADVVVPPGAAASVDLVYQEP
jgi:hypothetical protein